MFKRTNQPISLILRKISVVLILIIVTSAGYLWLNQGKAKAAGTVPVLLILHGMNGFSPPDASTASEGYDCKYSAVDPNGDSVANANSANGSPSDAFNAMMKHLPAARVITVGYYLGDTNCDASLTDSTRDYVNRCSGVTLLGQIGSNGEDLRHVGCELAWYLYENYNHNPVVVLAHSMGGLIIQWALEQAGHDANYPPYLNVPSVVTLDTPHGGVVGAGIPFFSLCNKCTQAGDMDPNDPFMKTLEQNLNPQGETGTTWITIGSDSDLFVQTSSQLHMIGPKYVYGWDQTSNPWYPALNHGGVFADESTATDGWVRECLGSCSPPGVSEPDFSYTPVTNEYHPLELAFRLLTNNASTSPPPAPAGWMVSTGGSMVNGWACDNTYGGQTSSLDFYANNPPGQGGIYLGNATANISRSDLVAAGVCGSTSYHGFQFDARGAGNGQHKIWVYNTVNGTYTTLGNSGNVTVSIGHPYPDGWFVPTGGSNVSGWACDETTVTNISQIDFYADEPFNQGGIYIGSIDAKINRSDLGGVCGSTAYHGFEFNASKAGSGPHKIWAYNIVSNVVALLGNSGNVTVSNAPPQPAGWMVSDGSITISGWACDNAFGGATSTVDFYANAPYRSPGSVYVGEAVANISRSDLVAAGVCGITPNHGFQFTVHLGIGQSETIWAYNLVSNTVTLLGNSGNVTVSTGGCPPTRCNVASHNPGA